MKMTYDIIKLKGLALNETGLVFDPMTGAIYISNQVGIKIISALREGLETEAIKQRILDEFDADAHTVERDVFDFLGQLCSYEMVNCV